MAFRVNWGRGLVRYYVVAGIATFVKINFPPFLYYRAGWDGVRRVNFVNMDREFLDLY